MEQSVTAELAGEHHERITEAEHEAEQAQEIATRAEREAQDLAVLLMSKADASHDHPQYVTHDEFQGIRESVERMLEATERAAEATEAAAEHALEAPESSAEGEAAGDVSELPLPEPEPEPEVSKQRRHGRIREVRR